MRNQYVSVLNYQIFNNNEFFMLNLSFNVIFTTHSFFARSQPSLYCYIKKKHIFINTTPNEKFVLQVKKAVTCTKQNVVILYLEHYDLQQFLFLHFFFIQLPNTNKIIINKNLKNRFFKIHT